MQAQEYWDDFTEMKHRMLERTSTSSAPWTIIRSNSKPKARLNAMKAILNAVDSTDPRGEYERNQLSLGITWRP